MAAHSVSILIETARDLLWGANQQKLDQLGAALSYAPGMDEMVDYDDWKTLYDLTKRNPGRDLDEEESRQWFRELEREIYPAAVSALGRQIAEWERLGRPRCHEDWFKAKYPETEES